MNHRSVSENDILDTVLLWLFILFVCFLSLHSIFDNDIFSHIKTGEYIIKSGHVPRVDIFSHTIAGEPWLDNQWLAQVVFYLVYSLFNLNGVILFKTGLLCAAFLIMFFTVPRQKEYSWVYFFLASVAVLASYGRFIERPENFTLLFCAIYFYIFVRRKYKLLFLIPFIQALWVNMHGGFIIGIALTLFFCVSEIIEAYIPFFRNRQVPGDRSRPGLAFGILTGVFLAWFVNPYGLKMLSYPFQFMGNKFLSANILEWLSPFSPASVNRIDGLVAFIFLIAACAAGFAFSFKSSRPFNVLSLLAFFWLGISARRNMPLFAISAYVFLGLALSQITANLGQKARSIALKLRPVFGIILAVLLSVLLFDIAVNRYYRRLRLPVDFGLGISTSLEPVSACRFMKQNKIGKRLFNEYDFGAYAIYALYPRAKVFIDGRIDTYGDSFHIKEYQPFWGADKELIKSLIKKYNIDAFLLKIGNHEPLMSYLLEDGSFKFVYFNEAAVVFVRDSPEYKSIIDKYEIKIPDLRSARDYYVESDNQSYGFDPLAKLFKGWVGTRAFPLREYNLGNFYGTIDAVELASQQFRKGISLFPEYKDLRYCLGNLYFRNCLGNIYFRDGYLDEAIESYSEVLKYDKKDYKVFKVLGDLYLRKNDYSRAVKEYEKSIAISPLYDTNVYKILATVYHYYLNDNSKARFYYSEYLRLAKNNLDRQEVEDALSKLSN